MQNQQQANYLLEAVSVVTLVPPPHRSSCLHVSCRRIKDEKLSLSCSMFCCLYNQERDTLNNSVVQSPVSANPGLTLYMLLIKANPELVLICNILNIFNNDWCTYQCIVSLKKREMGGGEAWI